MSRYVMERRGRDDSDRILDRRQYVKRHPEIIGGHSLRHGDASRFYEMGAFAIRDQSGVIMGRLRRRCHLGTGGYYSRSRGQTN